MALLSAGGALGENEKPTPGFMRQKLNYSQGILEGLVLEKFELVITNATALRNMNVTNVFYMLGNQDYRRSITNFQQDVDGLVAAAKAKSLPAATEAYTKVATECIQCHQMFRRDQFVRHQLKK